jgi:hypothetical protein
MLTTLYALRNNSKVLFHFVWVKSLNERSSDMPSALVRIFNAILSPLFSAAAELRMIHPIHWSLAYVNPSLLTFEWSCSIHPRRLTPSDFLEEQFEKARSSMSLRTHLMIFYSVRIPTQNGREPIRIAFLSYFNPLRLLCEVGRINLYPFRFHIRLKNTKKTKHMKRQKK